MKNILKLLPKNLRDHLLRQHKTIISDELDQKLSVQIASEYHDLKQAYALLYEAYVSAGLMDENQFRIRCNLFSFLPNTICVVAKVDNKVVGTVALIRDSMFGIPSDKEFLKENNQLRESSQTCLIEVSALAVDKKFRNKKHSVIYLMIKYAYQISIYYLKATHFVCVVHPRTEDFYRALLNFKKRGKVVSYNFVKGALGIHLHSDIRLTNIQNFLKYKYSELLDFCLKPDNRCKFPKLSDGQILSPVMTNHLFHQFLKLSGLTLNYFNAEELNALNTLFDTSEFKVNNFNLPKMNEYRYPLNKSAIIAYQDRQVIANIFDISSNGAFLQLEEHYIYKDENIELRFHLNSKIYYCSARVLWSNYHRDSLKHPVGIGIQFDQAIPELLNEIYNWQRSSRNLQLLKAS